MFVVLLSFCSNICCHCYFNVFVIVICCVVIVVIVVVAAAAAAAVVVVAIIPLGLQTATMTTLVEL